MFALLQKYASHMAKHAISAHKSFFAVRSHPPISPKGDALFSFVNNSGKTAYVQVVGRDPTTGKDVFVKYDPDGTFVFSPSYPGEDSTQFAYSSSYFTNGTLYLPVGDGMRLYVSVDKPIIFFVNSTINAPDPANPVDPNHGLVWDKIEFNVSASAVFTNPTAVDSFALPLHVEQTSNAGVVFGGGISVDRSKVFEDIKTEFANTAFLSLVADEGNVVFSPKYGASTNYFPNDYLVTSGWLSAFKKFFAIKELVVDMSESFPSNEGGGIWRALVENDILVFIRDVDDKHPKVEPVVIGIPTTVTEWIGAAGPSWFANTDLKRAIVRNVTCAAETNTLVANIPLNAAYFDSKRSVFYETNVDVPADLQFIDLYSKVLHSYGDHEIYTFAYDDELNQSGAASLLPSDFAKGVITLSKV